MVYVRALLMLVSVNLVLTEEQHCSKYDFLEKVLEKLVRMEFNEKQKHVDFERINSSVVEAIEKMESFSTNVKNEIDFKVAGIDRQITETVTKVDETVAKVNETVALVADDMEKKFVKLEKQIADKLHTLQDGAWSGWNEWSNCSTASGCSGVQTRSRSCSNPYPSSYGKYCIGNPMEMSACISSNCLFEGYRDCTEIKSSMGAAARTGLYNIYLHQSKKEVEVYCDMDTIGGGWTVFQRRFIGYEDFYRNFNDYENGFGPVNGEFWLGLKTIHELTSLGRSELRIDLTAADGSHVYELFQNFSLSPGRDYTLHIDKGTGTAGDTSYGLSFHNGYNFATKDNDDRFGCAKSSHGGWWYHYCAHVNLNGHYEVPGTTSSYGSGQGGVIYFNFKQHQSLKSTSMMLRRNK